MVGFCSTALLRVAELALGVVSAKHVRAWFPAVHVMKATRFNVHLSFLSLSCTP